MNVRVAGSIPGPFLNDYRAYGCGVTVSAYPQASSAPIPGLPPGLCPSCGPRRSSLVSEGIAPAELSISDASTSNVMGLGAMPYQPFAMESAPSFRPPLVSVVRNSSYRSHPRG